MKQIVMLLFFVSFHSLAQEYIYEKCAVENGICAVSGTQTVRYGANGKYVEKIFRASTPCTNAVFGDPIYGVAKQCDIKKLVQSPPRTTSKLPQLGTYPIISGNPVFSGCPAPATTYSRQIVLDAAKGETLAKFFGSKQVLAGDHIIVKGAQGAFNITRYTNPELMASTKWIKIEGQGATFTKVFIGEGLGKFLISKIKVVSEVGSTGGTLFGSAAVRDIVLADSEFYGILDSSKWEIYDWLNAANGINIDNTTCVSLLRNKMKNLRFGITINNREATVAGASKKALIYNNDLRNLSGDFIRPLGSDITVQYNVMLDGYVDGSEGDGNHDDFIQGFTSLGVPYTNVKILDNFMVENTTPGRKFASEFQGITVFDGIYSNFLIARNIVIASAYHGISMYGGKNGIIENNTVLSSYPNFGRAFWIGTFNKKDGKLSENVIVRNNITNTYKTSLGAIFSNNYSVKMAESALNFMVFDVPNASYDLRLKSTSPIYGKNAGALR